jgi:hypothetical protein
MTIIRDPDQAELPIAEKIVCRRCRGIGTVYYVRTGAPVVGGKRIACIECDGRGCISLTGQLFRYDVASYYRNRHGTPRKSRRNYGEST